MDRIAVAVTLDPYLSVKAAAQYMGVSVRTLQYYINDLPPHEALPCFRLPSVPRLRRQRQAKYLVGEDAHSPERHRSARGMIRIRLSALDDWLARYRTRGRPSLVAAIRELGILTRPDV